MRVLLPSAPVGGAAWSRTAGDVTATLILQRSQLRVGDVAVAEVVVQNGNAAPVRFERTGCDRAVEILVELNRKPVQSVEVGSEDVAIADQTRLDVSDERFGGLRTGCRSSAVTVAPGERYSERQEWQVRSVNDVPFAGSANLIMRPAFTSASSGAFDIEVSGNLTINGGGDANRLTVDEAVRAAFNDSRVASLRASADPRLSEAERRPSVGYENKKYRIGFLLRRNAEQAQSFSVLVDGTDGTVSEPVVGNSQGIID